MNPSVTVSGTLPVGNGHTLYWEQYGPANGVPVLCLHGGPGTGRDTYIAGYMDTSCTRIIMFDQRGCGQSRASGTDPVEHNNTAALVQDIEILREHLGVACWIVQGGSWGSTLALAYAATHPSRCRALVLNSIFLARPQDEAWFLGGVRSVYPDIWASLVEGLAETAPAAIVEAYWQRLNNPDRAVRAQAAARFGYYMARLLYLESGHVAMADPREVREADINAIRLFLHYSRHEYFFDGQGVLGLIRQSPPSCPVHILHGRYDMDTPLYQAFDLLACLPQARLQILTCGHSDTETAMREALQQTLRDVVESYASV